MPFTRFFAQWGVRAFGFSLVILAGLALLPAAHAESHASTSGDSSSGCPRFSAGDTVLDPPSLHSQNGMLKVDLAYNTATDADGRTLFCFTTPDGKESPTLYVRPGDTVIVNVTNHVPAGVSASAMRMSMNTSDSCGPSTMMDASSMNLHYHGTNLPPTCRQDEVLSTVINSGESYQYELKFPADEPSGLYWYHPHIHGISEAAVQGGASGAIVVEGLQDVQPEIAGMHEHLVVIRDQTVAGNPTPGGPIPSWDLSLNFVPIAYPAMIPAVMHMNTGQDQFWRIANASADSLVDLQVVYDGVPQTLGIVALDGVATGSQDGTRRGKVVYADHIFIPTAGRAEFFVKGSRGKVRTAILRTLNVATGPAGDNDPERILAKLTPDTTQEEANLVPAASGMPGSQRFEGLAAAFPDQNRKLYFSEVISDPSNPSSPTNFYITVDGATPKLFSPENPPAIVTTQGSVEDWTIENRATENHEFHIHQIHFLLEARNGVPVPADQQQYLDTVQIPYWSGKGPYPSVKVRMDFRGEVVGDFVYHCHILGHEDNGMMSIIRVLPNTHAQVQAEAARSTASAPETVLGDQMARKTGTK